MTWTTERPTVPGYYFLHEPPAYEGEHTEPVMVEVYAPDAVSRPDRLAVHWVGIDTRVGLRHMPAESRWQGPIPIPEPAAASPAPPPAGEGR